MHGKRQPNQNTADSVAASNRDRPGPSDHHCRDREAFERALESGLLPITVQKDIAFLIDTGYPIEVVRSTQNRYYMTEQLFELPELKLLIDAVESGKFITAKKSRILAEKLTTLTVRSERESLKRNISIIDRVKTGSEQLYYIMDVLNEAINRKKKVSFLYFGYFAGKSKKLKNDGEPYILSP